MVRKWKVEPFGTIPTKGPVPVQTPAGNPTVPACGLVVFESRHEVRLSGPLTDSFARFYLVVSGHARWESGSRRYMLGPDTLCHIPAGLASRQETLPNDPVSVYIIRYRPDLLSAAVGSQFSAMGMLPLDLGSTHSNQANVVRSIFQEMLFEQDAGQEGWELILQSRLIDLAVRALRMVRRRGRDDLPAFEPGSDSTDRVARYALRLKSRFYRQETLSEAARAAGLSRRQFTELFRKVTGQSWRHYVLGLRLRHAAELLTETDRSVLAVAFESGFEDLSHFHHCFKSVHCCSPLAYREQRQVRLPSKERRFPEPLRAGEASPGFKWRGMKGWFWTAEQYLEEIQVLASLKMNFLMDCYGSMIVSQPGEPWCNEWWKPMTDARKGAYGRVICTCHQTGIIFCFALHPQLASPRPLDPLNPEDLERFYSHYEWAQQQRVQWFSICLDGTSWSPVGPAACGQVHARLASTVLERLRAEDPDAQLVLCPVPCWGDGTNPEHHAYLEALARDLHPAVYIFWNGDSIVTPRITRVAAESYRKVVQHRLFLWDNYPVNDGSPTLHLGPVSGREADLCDVIDGYLSNPMCTQNQINRIPLATCADYAYNPRAYNPARSISQAILRFGKTDAQRRVLKDLVEAYPGFIVAGGGTGTNPVRGKFGGLFASPGSRPGALAFLRHMENTAAGLSRQFPKTFPATKKTIAEDIAWMKAALTQLRIAPLA
jgi:AraC-like DNA-binding protein